MAILGPMANLSPVPLFDLSRETSLLRTSIDEAIGRVIDSGRIIMATEHAAFESEFATYVGTTHAIGVANGTDALEIALSAVGVRAGGVVITVPNAGGYTSIATYRLGATPAYCDVAPDTLLMSAESLAACLDALEVTPQAIVVTHLFGALAPMDEIMQLARTHDIPVVEDCAQSIGARRNGVMCGNFGDVATTSFYPTKNLGAYGDGGAIFTNNTAIAEYARKARQYGWTSKYHVECPYGRNSRLDELQAAILRVKLGQLDESIARRTNIFDHYQQANASVLVDADHPAFAPHLAVIRTRNRTRVVEEFTALGISTDVHYPVLDHQQPAWSGLTPVSLAVSETAVQQILSVPMFPFLTEDEIARVCAGLASVAE